LWVLISNGNGAVDEISSLPRCLATYTSIPDSLGLADLLPQGIHSKTENYLTLNEPSLQEDCATFMPSFFYC
jgi:hypothetical protein